MECFDYFCFDWTAVCERERGLINNLYDDMESHNSKAVSEIYLSTGYFQSLLPIGNGTWQKDAWTKRRKNYWCWWNIKVEYFSLNVLPYFCKHFRMMMMRIVWIFIVWLNIIFLFLSGKWWYLYFAQQKNWTQLIIKL